MFFESENVKGINRANWSKVGVTPPGSTKTYNRTLPLFYPNY